MNASHSEQDAGSRRWIRRTALILGIIAGALACAYLACCALAAYTDTFFPGTRLENVAVGGMTAQEAAEALNAELSGRVFPVRLDSGEGDPALVLTAEQLGLVPDDAPAAAEAACRACRSGSFLADGAAYLLSALRLSEPVRILPELSDDAWADIAQNAAERLSIQPVDAAYAIEGSSLMILTPRDGRRVDADALATALKAVRQEESPEKRAVVIPSAPVSAKVLTAQQIHDEIAGEMRGAVYDAATDTILPEVVGVSFDPVAAQRLMDATVPGTYAAVAVEVVRPPVTAAELEAVLFRDVLGSYTTSVSGSSARRSNVKLSAASINGLVLNSGDVFSYNGSVGQRTAAAGYQAAPAYVGGQTVDEIGGGICQTSSTLYMTCLLANLEITQRHAHRYATGYMPYGMDATVSWGGPDYKFTNNTDYPIRIVTEYQNHKLTVTLYGTKTDDITVKMTYDYLEKLPWKTVYKEDPSMAPGTEKETTSPYTGHKVQTYRSLYDGSGKLISKTPEAYSYYKARDKVITRGPALPPPPVQPEVPAGGGTEIPAEPETPAVPDSGGAVTPDKPADTPPAEEPVPDTPAVTPDTPAVTPDTPPAEEPAETPAPETPPAETPSAPAETPAPSDTPAA